MSYAMTVSLIVLMAAAGGLATYYVVSAHPGPNPYCTSQNLTADQCFSYLAEKNKWANLTYSSSTNLFSKIYYETINAELKLNGSENVSEDRTINKTRLKLSVIDVLGQETDTESFKLPEGNFTCDKNPGQNWTCATSFFTSSSILEGIQSLINISENLSYIENLSYGGSKNLGGRTCDNFDVNFNVTKIVNDTYFFGVSCFFNSFISFPPGQSNALAPSSIFSRSFVPLCNTTNASQGCGYPYMNPDDVKCEMNICLDREFGSISELRLFEGISGNYSYGSGFPIFGFSSSGGNVSAGNLLVLQLTDFSTNVDPSVFVLPARVPARIALSPSPVCDGTNIMVWVKNTGGGSINTSEITLTGRNSNYANLVGSGSTCDPGVGRELTGGTSLLCSLNLTGVSPGNNFVSAQGNANYDYSYVFCPVSSGHAAIINPSFESGSSGWSLAFGHFVTSTKAHTGNHSLESDYSCLNCTAGVATYTPTYLYVKNNTLYNLTGWIYNSLNSGSAYLDLNNGAGYPGTFTDCKANSTTGYNNWQQVSCTFNTGNAYEVRVRLVTDGNINGSAWFDDIDLNQA